MANKQRTLRVFKPRLFEDTSMCQTVVFQRSQSIRKSENYDSPRNSARPLLILICGDHSQNRICVERIFEIKRGQILAQRRNSRKKKQSTWKSIASPIQPNEPIRRNRLDNNLPHTLTWMQDSRPGKLTFGVFVCIESEWEFKNTRFLHLHLNIAKQINLYKHDYYFIVISHAYSSFMVFFAMLC